MRHAIGMRVELRIADRPVLIVEDDSLRRRARLGLDDVHDGVRAVGRGAAQADQRARDGRDIGGFAANGVEQSHAAHD